MSLVEALATFTEKTIGSLKEVLRGQKLRGREFLKDHMTVINLDPFYVKVKNDYWMEG
jgi:hypothetical protein